MVTDFITAFLQVFLYLILIIFVFSSKDIRSYFSKTPESKKTDTKTGKNTLEDSVNKKRKSRKRVFIDSDSEEEKSTAKKEKGM